MVSEPRPHARLLYFAIVGIVAGVVDMAVVQALVMSGGGLYASRLVSYACAATVAWWLNRRFTFADRRSATLAREWSRYLVVNLSGGVVNYAVYALLVSTSAVFARFPFAAVAFGSLAGMLVNFTMSSRFVFSRL